MGLVLTGFMGTGKSTIAKELASNLSMEIVEMDQQISVQEGMEISEIFSQYGEEHFRNLETELLKAMQKKKNVIISCGGGTPLRECNVSEMKKIGKVILLTARPETIWNRVKDSTERPLLTGHMNVQYIEELMKKRKEKYEAAADYVIDTDGKSVPDICGEIIEKIREENCYV